MLSLFSEPVQHWFAESFAAPTAVQTAAWPRIAAGEHTLLLAPTGSGKTLAAFLASLDALARRGPPAEKGIHTLYISPLKALVYDVDRNLRAPLAGIARTAARLGLPPPNIRVDVRTGDTPQRERQAQLRDPGDILVTTPESLFLLLTSSAAENLRGVRTVILDEIHVLAGQKRGVHLALSLERLSELCPVEPQRVGLSATQRPLDAVARYLGGDRAVSIVDKSEPPRLDLQIRVPIDDMENPPVREVAPAKPDGEGAKGRGRAVRMPETDSRSEGGIWPSIYPELLELIRSHKSTLVFVNSRLLCERLAQRLNEMAGEELVRTHHGSMSHARRAEVEDALKSGRVPALVATSSLELGIDMGAVDLVVLVESPGGVARGLQRVGRAGHAVGEVSEGRIFPKFRGDLLESTVVAHHMREASIERTEVPRNCLDVLAQQLVAICANGPRRVDELLALVRRTASFSELSRDLLEAVLDMLSGRYPSDEFADLVPRLNWDRGSDEVSARRGAKTLAVMNAGTIPDRGLYTVQLGPEGPRLGELDEEMVFETREGDTLILGASTWRVEEIGRDRVYVSPAPGEPGRLPFWRGERPGRPVELGRSLGEFLHELEGRLDDDAESFVADYAPLDTRAAKNLVAYVRQQRAETGAVPSSRSIVVERFRDELGDWRVCILTPFGARVHAPWALALESTLSETAGFEVQVMWSDDGIALRLVDTDDLMTLDALFPTPDEVEERVTTELSHSALFAARFRENAARALLLPRRGMNRRAPLWMQRRRAETLLAVAQRYPSFPIVLETYRECLQDVFDMPALKELLGGVQSRAVRVHEVETKSASPFARSLVFQYTAAYLYETDAPLAERRAHALSLDRAMLRELLGQEDLRELLDADAVSEVERELQYLDDERRPRHEDGLCDLLRRLGDLTFDEVRARYRGEAKDALDALVGRRRILLVRIGGEARYIAIEDAARYRDALGVALPPGIPEALLAPVDDAVQTLLARWARTHGPFETEQVAERFGLPVGTVKALLRVLEAEGRLIHGEIRPGGLHREWCDPEVLRRIKQRTLARLRKEVAPVSASTYARFLLGWQGIGTRRGGAERLLEVVDQLEGLPVAYSSLVDDILPARVSGFSRELLDMLGATGAVVWIGKGPLGPKDGRIALYRRERVAAFVEEAVESRPTEGVARRLLEHLEERGASFTAELQAVAGGMPIAELLEVLWDLAWAGLITNDTFAPLNGLSARASRRRPRELAMVGGRWSPVRALLVNRPTDTERLHLRAMGLLERYGVVGRECAIADEVAGGFAALYPVYRALEEAGRARRGYFVEDLGGSQFALAGVVDRLRAARTEDDAVLVLAADDPANPWGSVLAWPETNGPAGRPRRVAGARVVLVGGDPVLFLEKGSKSMLTFKIAADGGLLLERAVKALAEKNRLKTFRVAKVDGEPAREARLSASLVEAGFARDYGGLVLSA